jgi:hypothetical protein
MNEILAPLPSYFHHWNLCRLLSFANIYGQSIGIIQTTANDTGFYRCHNHLTPNWTAISLYAALFCSLHILDHLK